jgi:hypothetical protein
VTNHRFRRLAFRGALIRLSVQRSGRLFARTAPHEAISVERARRGDRFIVTFPAAASHAINLEKGVVRFDHS